MSESWLDPFFRQRRVAVLAIPREGKSPLATPVWYDYDGKHFRIQVEATSAKAKVLSRQEVTPVALTIQSEVPPYRYAVVHGKARLTPTRPELRLNLARRYFGRLGGDMYDAEEKKRGMDLSKLRVIEIEPERTVAHDFRPEAGWSGRLYFAIYRLFRPVPA